MKTAQWTNLRYPHKNCEIQFRKNIFIATMVSAVTDIRTLRDWLLISSYSNIKLKQKRDQLNIVHRHLITFIPRTVSSFFLTNNCRVSLAPFLSYEHYFFFLSFCLQCNDLRIFSRPPLLAFHIVTKDSTCLTSQQCWFSYHPFITLPIILFDQNLLVQPPNL